MIIGGFDFPASREITSAPIPPADHSLAHSGTCQSQPGPRTLHQHPQGWDPLSGSFIDQSQVKAAPQCLSDLSGCPLLIICYFPSGVCDSASLLGPSSKLCAHRTFTLPPSLPSSVLVRHLMCNSDTPGRTPECKARALGRSFNSITLFPPL